MRFFLWLVLVAVLLMVRVGLCLTQLSYGPVLKLARERCNTTCWTLGRYSKGCKACKRILQDCDPFSGKGPYLGDVENVDVKFSGTLATISWSAINLTGVVGAGNFTGYYVMWLTHPIEGNVHKNLNFSGTCKEVKKCNDCHTVVQSSRRWDYPDSIMVFVTTAPLPRLRKITLATYSAPDSRVEYIHGLPTQSPPTNLAAWIAIGVSGGVVLAGMFAVFIYRGCGGKTAGQQTDRFEHDLFISYSRQDGEFLTHTLLPLLEKHSIKYCIDYKDWIPGKPWHENLVHCIRKSRKILIIASSNSVSSTNCKAELEQALYWAGSNIIILRIDSFSIDLLPSSVAKKTFIDYSDSLLERRTWQARLIKTVTSTKSGCNGVSRQHLSEFANNNLGVHQT